MAGRQTRGRQRIPMRRIENQDDLYATFSKRRLGLYKKASELSTLCGVDIGVIIFSPTNNPYSFFHPTMESVVNRFRNPNQPTDNYARVVESQTRSRIQDLNRRLDEILEEKDKLKEHNQYLDEINKTRQKGWWEETPVESLNKEQVKQWIAWFQAFQAQVQSRIQELKNEGSTSAAIQQNPEDSAGVPGPSTGLGPSIFAPGASYAPGMGTAEFPGQYYGVPPQAQDPSSAGGSDQYFLSPLPQDPFAAGGSGQNPSQYLYPPPQDPSASGGSGHVPSQPFFPLPSLDPSGSGSGDVPGQFFFPPPSHDQSTGGRSGYIASPFFFPPPPQDLSGGGNSLIPGQFFLHAPPLDPSTGGGSANPIPGQFRRPRRPLIRSPSAAAGGSGQAGTDDEEQDGN